MTITLREITKDNYRHICALEVTDEQKGNLSSNMESILESKFHETLTPRAIYSDEVPVGFIMGERTSEKEIEIFRFMIDQEYQKKGIGRTALELVFSEIKLLEGVTHIQICYHPDNEIAKRLYLNVGFTEIGMDESGDDMLAVKQL